ncbi:Anaphase-promoting complex subunit 1, partial [Choanephora cucurbitarum]
LICLHNTTTNQLQLINLEKAFQKDTNIIEFKSTAKSAISVNATRDSCKDLLFLDVDGHLWLWVDGRMPLISVPLPSSQPVIDISQNVYDRFNLQYQNETIRYRIHLQPKSSIVRNCLAAFDCAHTPFFATFWYRFIQLKQQHVDWTEWHVLFVSLLSFIPLKRTQRRLAKKILVGEGRQGIPDDWMDQAMTIQTEQTLSAIELNGIIKSLHVVYEDYRMKNTMKFHLEHLGYLLMQLCVILNHSSWIKYYQQEGILLGLTHGFCLAEEQIEEALIDPPKMEVCLQQMVSRSGAIPVLLSFFGVDTLTPTFTHCRNTYAKTVQDLWSMYHAIYYNDNDPALLVNRLTQCQINRMQIETLDRSIAAPILEALRRLQESPQLTWNKDFYYIIERYDIYKQLQLDTTVCDPNTDIFKLPLSEMLTDNLFDTDTLLKKSKIVSMDDIMNEVLGVPTQRCIYESDVLNMETERLRFGFGGVIEGVRTMLDASHIPEHTIPPTTSENDDDIATEHQSQVVFLVQRTLALATGRAIYAYATHIPDLTKTLPIEPIQLAAKILPLRTIVHLDESIWNKEFLQWPHFHNGIAAGLRISPSNQVNDSWISFCHSGDLEPHHGGMLLAMGLNGILRRLTLESWYHMIRQDCSLVSVGFILGIAAAYRNTEDKKVTKLLSAYIPALLDQQAAPFDQSNLILSSSLLGLGLIHMNTRDVKLAFVMLQELERNAANDLSGLETDYQTCALAAGFSLGFIMLGRGNDQRMDPDLFKRLCLLMLGNDEQRRINLDITSPGATMALGLMYLKTEADDVARLIEIPTTRPLLNYVRPDFLMLRAIARNLILWSQIQPTSEWIKDQVPAFMRQSAEDEDEQEVINQARYNIMSGAFLCLGLRFAGSKNQEAFTFLLRYLDHFIRLLNINAVSFQQRITHTIIRTCIDILCTAAAMIMAGTGNLGLLKRLKMLYGMVNGETSYGDHMAFSMSMGLLFAGLGGYTLTTTNEAIAGLLCAFYPFYPLSTDDNRYHLQAFRHLWVLAVDSRWLMPVEVSTKKPCRVPIQLEIYEDDHTNPLVTKTARQVRLEAPMVVPDYKLIKSIKIDGNRYWPLLIDMTVKSAYQESIKKSGVLHVQLKEGKKTYEEDPDGRSSLYEC